MPTLNSLDNVGGAAAVGGWTTSVFSSRTTTFTQTGKLAISMVGSGGGGAVASGGQSSATGGNSGPWGRKVIDISSGDVLVVNIGAGGLKSASNSANGNQGGTSTVTLNGVTILTIQGGEGGVFADLTATASASVPAATITGADFWVAGVRAGSAQCTSGSPSCSGGAAVDILQSGLGRSPAAVGAGITGVGGSVGTDSGGIPIPWIALMEWGFVITDGASATAALGSPGRGGVSGTIASGALAGGGAKSTTLSTVNGGIGAGGGGGNLPNSTGNGGPAYAFLAFAPLS